MRVDPEGPEGVVEVEDYEAGEGEGVGECGGDGEGGGFGHGEVAEKVRGGTYDAGAELKLWVCVVKAGGWKV